MGPPREDARRWLEARSQRVTVVGVVCAVLLCWTMVGPVVLLLLTWMRYRGAQLLIERGVFEKARFESVRADVTSPPNTVLEMWDVADHHLPDLSSPGRRNPLDAVVRVLAPLVAAASLIVPSIPVRYVFTLDGRLRSAGRYMFGRERFVRDPDGELWVWVDPKHPMMNTWLVSRMDE